MTGLAEILALLALNGGIFAFVPDGPNSESFGESELFPAPVAAFHTDGFVTGYRETKHDVFGRQELVNLDLARGFSIRRWYFGGTSAVEIGGRAGIYHQFVYNEAANENRELPSNELTLLGREYLAAANVGYLINGLALRLIWEADRRETEEEFLTGDNDVAWFGGDSVRLFWGDVSRQARYYFSYGRFENLQTSTGENLKQDFGYWGFDARFGDGSNGLKLVLGSEQRGYAYNNWGFSTRLRVGLERSKAPILGWRLLLDWSTGESDYAANYDTKTETTGLLFQHLF